jgi:hypothetical protein
MLKIMVVLILLPAERRRRLFGCKKAGWSGVIGYTKNHGGCGSDLLQTELEFSSDCVNYTSRRKTSWPSNEKITLRNKD